MLNEFITAVLKWRENRHTMQILARLTDQQLRDIGVERFDLEAAVRGVRA